VIRSLDDAGVSVDEIGLRRPTLDEVFLALTGGDAGRPDTAAHANTTHVTNGSTR
jgi:ABC-2 type transport system ATP-binding protein